MTLIELVPMLTRLRFDTSRLPITAGPVSLAELEYDEIEKYWHFKFRWRDIKLSVTPKALPVEIWQAINEHASAGHDDVMVFGLSQSMDWDDWTPTDEIETGLRQEIEAFTAHMLEIERLVEPWMAAE
jgi:hypothetical protein